ncbi:hypothetical protein [Symmachiella dynata]|uniref:hypothetical protein n=1 Tax=Symmachiella dynata TaxID=2527995 RepID=UPI0030EE7741|tara:strand:+ start:274 stop:897 length:624 start_codon:yes stop_codon:yes gene_type:complete
MPRQNPQKPTRRYSQRKSTPKVVDGRAQRKNRSAPTRTAPLIRREQPGKGYRHFVRKRDVLMFVDLLPDWDELSVGLNEIILDSGNQDCSGWQNSGQVAICAWERELISYHDVEFVEQHAELYQRLGIPFAKDEDDIGPFYHVQFNESTVRAYQLLHVFLHELGHHHDRITNWSQDASRGEPYAEAYAFKYEAIVFDRYVEAFGFCP